MAFLDTSALVDLTRQAKSSSHIAIVSLLTKLTGAGDVLFTSRINEAEFRVATFLPSATKRTNDGVEATIKRMAILDFDRACATTYAQLFAEMRARGKPVGRADVLIASIAIVNGQPVVTRNVRHFSAIPRVTVISY